MYGLILIAAAVLQDPPVVSVGKSRAAPYRAAVVGYREAEAALAKGDIARAHDKAASIIEDTRIERDKRECLLKIQNADSTWEKPVEFFPLRVRGQALLARAKKQLGEGNSEGALVTLKSAKKDLEESVGRHVPGSRDTLREVAELIAQHSTDDADPVLQKLRAYQAKLSEALSAEVAGSLTEAKRLFEEAVAIDPEGAKAKEGVSRMDLRLREEEAFARVMSTKGSAQEQIAACDNFLKKFPGGARHAEVAALRERITANLGEGSAKRRAELKNRWLDLRAARKCRSALDLVLKDGTFLTPEEIRDCETETRAGCEAHVAEAADRFRIALGNVKTLGELAARTPKSLERDFDLPPESEMVASSAALSWCRLFRSTLDKLRALGADAAPAAVMDLLADLWRGVPALVEEGENAFFRSVAGYLKDAVERRLRAIVEQSKSASTQELAKLKEEANALLTRLEEFDQRLTEALATREDKGKAWREVHAFWRRDVVALKDYPNALPRDAGEIEMLGRRLSDWQSADGAYGQSPRAVLERIENDLLQVYAQKGWSLTRENRQKLFTYAIVAAAQRLLLEGKRVEEVASELAEYGRRLKTDRGAIEAEVRKHGPKVERVFALLLK